MLMLHGALAAATGEIILGLLVSPGMVLYLLYLYDL
jgi:hypothetical protein